MRLLLVTADDAEAHGLSGRLHERTQSASWSRVHTVDEARRALATGWFDAILLRPGPKTLSLRAFLAFLRSLPKQPKVLLLGADAEGATRLEGGSVERVIDQLLAVLGLTRSAIHDHHVVAELEHAPPFELDLVRLPGSSAVVLRGASSIELGPADLELARRAASVTGPGLPRVIDAFWDDPRPHAFYDVPPGVSLLEVRQLSPALGRDAALAVLHGVSVGVATMHAAGFSAGVLGAARVWLTERGEVLLTGNGFAQLTPTTSRFMLTVPGSSPPEEGSGRPPSMPGDAFRLGMLLHLLVGAGQPFAKLDQLSYLRGDWPPLAEVARTALGTAATLFDRMLLSDDALRAPVEGLADALAGFVSAPGPHVQALVRLARSAPHASEG